MDVTVYGPLRSATDSKTVTVAVDGNSVDAVLAAFVDAYPGAESHLVDASGDLRPSVRVMVDGDNVDPAETVPANAEVAIFPAMRGG